MAARADRIGLAQGEERSMIAILRKILRRPKPAAPIPVRQDWEDWPTVVFRSPPRGVDLVIMRREWEFPRISRAEEWDAAMNVAGLHWRIWRGETINETDALPSIWEMADPIKLGVNDKLRVVGMSQTWDPTKPVG